MTETQKVIVSRNLSLQTVDIIFSHYSKGERSFGLRCGSQKKTSLHELLNARTLATVAERETGAMDSIGVRDCELDRLTLVERGAGYPMMSKLDGVVVT